MSSESGTPTASPEKQALLQAFNSVLKSKADAAEAERAARAARRRGRRTSRALLAGSLALLLAVAVYVYSARPDWIFPAPPPPESLAVREASLRITIANTAQHLEHFRTKTGRLPATLDEAEAHASGLRYEPSADGYRLAGASGEVRLSYASSQSLAGFVGNSFAVIKRRPK